MARVTHETRDKADPGDRIDPGDQAGSGNGAGPVAGPALAVVAAAIIKAGRLLVVSKKAAPDVFYLPGGKPEPGETARDTLLRELGEELGVRPSSTALLGHFDGVAALERLPMRMTVFLAEITEVPRPAAELAALGWTSGSDQYRPLLAPAVRDQVIPFLRGAGRLPG
jgi:8-oxo-dGTP diphosphatase